MQHEKSQTSQKIMFVIKIYSWVNKYIGAQLKHLTFWLSENLLIRSFLSKCKIWS